MELVFLDDVEDIVLDLLVVVCLDALNGGIG